MLEGVNTFNLSEQSMTQSGTLDTQLGELSDMIGDVTSVCEDDTQQVEFILSSAFRHDLCYLVVCVWSWVEYSPPVGKVYEYENKILPAIVLLSTSCALLSTESCLRCVW